MTDRDLNEEWARSQLEAWADGSLPGESRERMAAALAADPKLRAAAERAVAVQRALRASSPARMPAGLRRRLLAIPAGSSNVWRGFALPVAASVAAAFVAAVWLRPEPPPPQEDPRVAAVAQDLEARDALSAKERTHHRKRSHERPRFGFARRSRRDPRGGRTRDR